MKNQNWNPKLCTPYSDLDFVRFSNVIYHVGKPYNLQSSPKGHTLLAFKSRQATETGSRPKGVKN